MMEASLESTMLSRCDISSRVAAVTNEKALLPMLEARAMHGANGDEPHQPCNFHFPTTFLPLRTPTQLSGCPSGRDRDVS